MLLSTRCGTNVVIARIEDSRLPTIVVRNHFDRRVMERKIHNYEFL